MSLVAVVLGCSGKVNEGVELPGFLNLPRAARTPTPREAIPAWARPPAPTPRMLPVPVPTPPLSVRRVPVPPRRPVVTPRPAPRRVPSPKPGVGQPRPGTPATPRVAAPSAETPQPPPTAQATVTPLETETPAPTATPEPTATTADVALAPGYVPRSTAITYRIPIDDLDDLNKLDRSLAVDEIVRAMKRNPRLELFVATYVERTDGKKRHAQTKTLADYLFLRVVRYLTDRGVDPTRIRGKGMGADDDVGRGIVAHLEVGEGSGPRAAEPTIPAPDLDDESEPPTGTVPS